MRTEQFDIEFQTTGLHYILNRLLCRYGNRYSAETIRQVMADAERPYLGSHIHAFVPLLVERQVRRILDSGEVSARDQV